MRRFFHRGIGSVLGLLAILMATLAPTVSHTLAADQRFDAIPSALCSAQSGTSIAGPDRSPLPEKAVHWQACAYCGLIAHMPFLPSGTSEVPPTGRATQPTANSLLQAIRRIFPFAAAQPRAPPLSS
ncbi:conserved hypothetical protein (plasmid) [Paraburkholderia atlantica]|uniref:DUF2946 domain-containing protein n=1 Tax=Paraburkholderia atlantica TaxID=2654982 RepID=D5WNN9_PARAM|nr:DUF2946 domain-containing protein [Paraburkholderia atlantica]ADG20918.1 conserved hypothetical protein [Paraburkholderia atlantica]